MTTNRTNTIRNTKTFDIELLYRNVFVFVLDIIEFTEILKQKEKDLIAFELLQTVTLWGESINSARSVKNLSNLKSKIEIALQETEKIKYWLNLCKYSNCCPQSASLLNELDKITERMKRKIQLNKLNISH